MSTGYAPRPPLAPSCSSGSVTLEGWGGEGRWEQAGSGSRASAWGAGVGSNGLAYSGAGPRWGPRWGSRWGSLSPPALPPVYHGSRPACSTLHQLPTSSLHSWVIPLPLTHTWYAQMPPPPPPTQHTQTRSLLSCVPPPAVPLSHTRSLHSWALPPPRSSCQG